MNITIEFEDRLSLSLSAQRGDDYRAERLFRVLGFLHRNGALPSTLIRLHDHAGILRACWSKVPKEMRAMRLMHAGWLAEGEQSVWHVLGDNPRAVPFLQDDGAFVSRRPV